MRRWTLLPVALAALLAALVAAPAQPVAANPLTEDGDAGDLPATAQPSIGSGVGPLTSISGTIASSTDADMYQICLTGGGTFSATTNPPGSASPFDAQLFLFDLDGFGVYANDDSPFPHPTLPAGHALTPAASGVYYLAISDFNRDPVSAGGLIFPQTFGAVNGPTGPGGGSPISGWVGSGITGSYTIALTGAEFCAPLEITITAEATGSLPPLTTKPCPQTVTNGPFTITCTGANPTAGNGIDEATAWTLDFTGDPGFEAFKACGGPLTSARLILTLTLLGDLYSTDTFGIVGIVPSINALDELGPLDFGVGVSLPFFPGEEPGLQLVGINGSYTADAILGVFEAPVEGEIAMGWQDDVMVSRAELNLTKACPPVCPGVADADVDGIEDTIDTEPGLFSDNFDDGTTFGKTNARGWALCITDLPPPDGVQATISGLGNTQKGATIATCGPNPSSQEQTKLDAAGETADITCDVQCDGSTSLGKTTVTAVVASPQIEVRSPSVGTAVELEYPNTGDCADVGSAITAGANNVGPILVQIVNQSDIPLGISFPLGPGQAADVTFPTDTIVTVTNLGPGPLAVTVKSVTTVLSSGESQTFDLLPVGGTVEFPGQSESPADASESSARDYTAPIAAAVAAGLGAVAAGGWYVRRRLLR